MCNTPSSARDFKRQFGEGVGGTPPGRTDQGWEVKLTLGLVPSSNANPSMEPLKSGTLSGAARFNTLIRCAADSTAKGDRER